MPWRAAQQWQILRLSAGRFVLAAYVPSQPVMNDTLAVYIEGDGFRLADSLPNHLMIRRLEARSGLQMALRNGKGRGRLSGTSHASMSNGKDARGCEAAYSDQAPLCPRT